MKRIFLSIMLILCFGGYAWAGPWISSPGGGGTGDVTKVGTPTNHQWGLWTGDGTLKGVSVTGSKVVCSDSNGQPTACTNLTDDADLGRLAAMTVDATANTVGITNGTASINAAAGVAADFNASITTNTALTVQTGAVTLTGNAAGSTLVLPASSLTLPTPTASGQFPQASGAGVFATSAYKLPTTVPTDKYILTSNGTDIVGSNTLQIGTFLPPSSDADPTALQFKHDSIDTDASAGGILEWHDSTNTRRVIDGAASAAANYTVVVKTEFIPVSWMNDGAAAPVPIATYETVQYRDFPDDSTKDLQFVWMTPLDLIGTTVKVRAIAMVSNGTAPANDEGVSWGISAGAVAASASVDVARGTVAFSMDTDLDEDCNAQYDTCYFPYVEVTPAVTVAAGTLMAFTVNRKHDEADDTYGQDIGLIGVEIKYKARINLVDTW